MTNWSYGLMTVPERRDTTLPRTLSSLAAAGFDKPRLFIDGFCEYPPYFLETTVHRPKLGAYGNWVLALWELYIREPVCDRYCVFQDDMIMSKNARAYLGRQRYTPKTYWNLMTFMDNEGVIKDKKGFVPSNQMGRGAVALVFDRKTVQDLLSARLTVSRPAAAANPTRCIDGTVFEALKPLGYHEMVHAPSLVEHTGEKSAMGNGPYPKALSFRGEEFDCLSLLC